MESRNSKRSALGCGAAIVPESISNDGVHISETQGVPLGLRANSQAVIISDMVLSGLCHDVARISAKHCGVHKPGSH
jgi:hypothetical protein